MSQVDLTLCNAFAYKVVLDWHMFQFHVESRVARDNNHAVIVTKKGRCHHLSVSDTGQ